MPGAVEVRNERATSAQLNQPALWDRPYRGQNYSNNQLLGFYAYPDRLGSAFPFHVVGSPVRCIESTLKFRT